MCIQNMFNLSLVKSFREGCRGIKAKIEHPSSIVLVGGGYYGLNYPRVESIFSNDNHNLCDYTILLTLQPMTISLRCPARVHFRCV